MIPRSAALALLALTAVSCGDWNMGLGGSVVEAEVVEVISTEGTDGRMTQRLLVELGSSLYRGDRVEVRWGGRRALNENGLLREGDRVLLSVSREGGERQYLVQEVVRLPAVLPFALVLALALVLVARWKGLAALLGLLASVGVFLLAIVPAVRRGEDPLAATVLGALAIVSLTVFAVHGFNRKSFAALVGTLAGLACVAALGAAALELARMTGFGTEEAVFLAVGSEGRIDLPRLLLSGVIVGSLGALVDMSVGQSSATFELASLDPRLHGPMLYRSALNVGRDHIASLVNTLALAYFGGALPLIVLLSLGFQPLSVALNSEEIVESLLTVVVASAGLVLCVPVTTAAAVWLVGHRSGAAAERRAA